MIHPQKELDTGEIRFSAAAETYSLNYTARREHRMAITRRVRIAVNTALKNITAPDWPAYEVLITRVGPRMLDNDNAIGALKPVRDEIACWLNLDDADPRVVWSYDQRVECAYRVVVAKHVFRTWIEVVVAGKGPGGDFTGAETGRGADTPSNDVNYIKYNSGSTRISRAGPPPRLEREKTRPDRPAEPDPENATYLSPRANGQRVRVARIGDDVFITLHWTQQDHAWRSPGIRLEPNEIEGVVKCLLTPV